MPENETATRVPARRRGRPRRVESFSEWMARIDIEVEQQARKVEARLPADRLLTCHQRRIVEMLIEHMRSLPVIPAGEDCTNHSAYGTMNFILTHIFRAKYPSWQKRFLNGSMDLDGLEYEPRMLFLQLLRNCGGYAAPDYAASSRSEDDDDD